MKSCKSNGVNDLRLWGQMGGVKKLHAGSKVKDPTRKTDVWGTRRTSSGKSQSQNPHPFRKNRERMGHSFCSQIS
jgi:hypothetical protein